MPSDTITEITTLAATKQVTNEMIVFRMEGENNHEWIIERGLIEKSDGLLYWLSRMDDNKQIFIISSSLVDIKDIENAIEYYNYGPNKEIDYNLYNIRFLLGNMEILGVICEYDFEGPFSEYVRDFGDYCRVDYEYYLDSYDDSSDKDFEICEKYHYCSDYISNYDDDTDDYYYDDEEDLHPICYQLINHIEDISDILKKQKHLQTLLNVKR